MVEIKHYAESLVKEDFRPKLKELLGLKLLADNPEETAKKVNLPPRIDKFIKGVGKGINSLEMIKDGDHILIGISGGKDSLTLALALALRKRHLPIDYKLEAVQVLWSEYPMTAAQTQDFEDYFAMLGIKYTQLPASMYGPKIKKRFSCYICSRNRKRILFDYANEVGANKIAFGHHLDDIIQTTLMNMVYGGQLATMMPKQDFFGGDLQLIRPMCQCRERQVMAIAHELALPVISIACPYRDDSGRMAIKPVIEQLEQILPGAKENMYKALFNVKAEYLPGVSYKK